MADQKEGKKPVGFLNKYITGPFSYEGLGLMGGAVATTYPLFKGMINQQSPANLGTYSQIMKNNPNMRVVDIGKMGFGPEGIQRMMKGPHFDPRNKTIYMMGKDPSILAHEMGHYKQFDKPSTLRKGFNYSRGITGFLSPFYALGVLTTKDQDTAQRRAATASAMMLPTLAHEIDASYHGRKILMDAEKNIGNLPVTKGSGGAFKPMSKGSQFIRSLAPFKGVPSYLLAAMTPYIMYKSLARRGKYGTGDYSTLDGEES